MRALQCCDEGRSRDGFLSLILVGVLMTWLPSALAHHSFAALLTEDGGDVIETYDGTNACMRAG